MPRVAASLTTALILFLASLSFAPVREWLFGKEVKTYPISCTADPVPAADGRRLVEFYIVNRSRRDLGGEELAQQLQEALRGTGASASPAITLPFTGEMGRIEAAYPDAKFNEGKGEMTVRFGPRGVRIDIGRIDESAILRANIIVADLPDLGPFPRDAKVLVPFDFADIQERCYTRG